MNTYSIYRLESGEFLTRQIQTSDPATLARFVPAGCAAIHGVYDPLRQRVNVQTGEVERWHSPQIDVQSRERRVDAARGAIGRLEASQARAVREALVNPNSETRERLAELDRQISQQRAIINGRD